MMRSGCGEGFLGGGEGLERLESVAKDAIQRVLRGRESDGRVAVNAKRGIDRVTLKVRRLDFAFVNKG